MNPGCLFFFLLPVAALVAFLKMRPGTAGELLLHVLLRARLDRKRFRILHDVMLPAPDGTTTQIDHIVLSTGGIFVIEAKTFGNDPTRSRGGCWIFGGERDREWTVSYPGARKFRFQNPLRQNFKHIATLSGELGLPRECFRSVVAFAGTARFKTELPANVMGFGDVAGYIRSRSSADVFAPGQLAGIAEEILALQGSLSRRRKAAHVANLHRTHAGDSSSPALCSDAPEAPRCPRCGAPMVLRSRKSDGAAFWGCPGFPACRGARPSRQG